MLRKQDPPSEHPSRGTTSYETQTGFGTEPFNSTWREGLPPPQNSKNWSYVGEGRGSYQVVEQVVYVGEGNGSIDWRPPGGATSKSTNWKVRVCITFYYFIISMVLICLIVGIIFLVPCVKGIIVSAMASDRGEDGHSAGRETLETHHGVPASFDCSVTEPVLLWSPAKRRWCCKSEHVGCSPFTCDTDHDLQANWSDFERNWCCHYHHIGCSSATNSTSSLSSGGSSESKDALPYDCAAGYSHWRQTWSREKRQFCCKYGGRGCDSPDDGPRHSGAAHENSTASSTNRTAGEPSSTTVRAPSTTSREKGEKAKMEKPDHDLPKVRMSAAGASVRPLPPGPSSEKAKKFDCKDTAKQASWSVEKKFWCCEYGNVCPDKHTA